VRHTPPPLVGASRCDGGPDCAMPCRQEGPGSSTCRDFVYLDLGWNDAAGRCGASMVFPYDDLMRLSQLSAPEAIPPLQVNCQAPAKRPPDSELGRWLEALQKANPAQGVWALTWILCSRSTTFWRMR
jgi:hypothetical protein